MGNNPSTSITTTSGLIGNGDRSFYVHLPESVVLHFRGRQFKELDDGLNWESWELSYKVDNSTACRIILDKGKGTKNPHYGEKLAIRIVDDEYEEYEGSTIRFAVRVSVQNAEAGGLRSSMYCSSPTAFNRELAQQVNVFMVEHRYGQPSFTSSSTNNAIETRFYFYGYGTRFGLTIWEEKRIKTTKDNELKPYTATMTDYYVNTENGKNVGFSVALKRIRVVDGDGNLNFDVNGPEQHPASALLYMFDEIRRTKTWKPIYCPHCALSIIQRAGIWRSESESDTDNDVPVHGRRWSPGSLVSNGGRFTGKDIGNTYINKFFSTRRR